MDSINRIALRCILPIMNGMHTDRHHVGLSSCVKALSKGRRGSSLICIDACRNDRLLQQGIQVPENISQTIPDWVFPTGTGSSTWHQSRPDAVFVRSISGRPSHIGLTKILPQDRDIHLVEFKFCPDTNPFPTLEAATAQHTNTKTRLKTRSLRNPNRNNIVTLYIILVGVAGTTPSNLLSTWGTSRGGGVLGAWQWRAGEGKSGRPGAWWTTLQIPMSSVYGFLLG
eukprot:1161108-Pelagomonas_calceolata.AAC.1